MQDLATAIGAELVLSDRVVQRKHQIPEVRTAFAELRRPTPVRPQRLELPRTAFNTIVDVIDSHCSSYERTPLTAAKLQKEDYRNLLLANLNGAFNEGAVGEAFSKGGKVDVLLEIPAAGLFIAEAKMWAGPKTIEDGTSQLLSYLIWRDAFGLVLVFSRIANFDAVRAAIPEAIAALPSRRGGVHQVGEHHWLAMHVMPVNGDGTVEQHYLAYNVGTPQ